MPKGKSEPKPKIEAQSNGLEILDIADLLPDDLNARTHTPRNVGMITDALREVGTGRSGVIDEKGKVLAGNATLEALAQAGIRRVKVVESNGEEWVVVRRTGLNAKQKRRLALYDNRANDMSEWDLGILKEFNGQDLLAGMWTDVEVESLLERFNDFKFEESLSKISPQASEEAKKARPDIEDAKELKFFVSLEENEEIQTALKTAKNHFSCPIHKTIYFICREFNRNYEIQRSKSLASSS